jgi:hypothetical protein
MARSSAPISTMPPCARSRDTGNKPASLDAMAKRDPAGKDNASSVIASMHSGFVMASASSRTSTTGWRIDAIADASNGTTVIAALEKASVRSTTGGIGSIRSSAVAR